jgi:hypothetical protein
VKVLVLAFPSGVQFRLMFDHQIPEHFEPIEGEQVRLADDYGQTVTFTVTDDPVVFTQDTEQVDRLEVALMVRQKTNEIAAMQQLQSNPANMIVHPGRGLIS